MEVDAGYLAFIFVGVLLKALIDMVWPDKNKKEEKKESPALHYNENILAQGIQNLRKEFEDLKSSTSKIKNSEVIDTLAYMEHLLEKFGTKLEDEELTRQRFELHMERKQLDHETKTQDKLDGLNHIHHYFKKPKSDEILEEPEKEAKGLYERARKQNKLFETHGS